MGSLTNAGEVTLCFTPSIVAVKKTSETMVTGYNSVYFAVAGPLDSNFPTIDTDTNTGFVEGRSYGAVYKHFKPSGVIPPSPVIFHSADLSFHLHNQTD